MLKKFFTISAILVILGAILFGSDVISVAGTARDNAQEAAEDILGLEFQIDRAKNSMKGADAEIYDANRTLAELEVTIKGVEAKLRAAKENEIKNSLELVALVDKFEESDYYSVSSVGSSSEDQSKQREWKHRIGSSTNRLKLLRATIATYKVTSKKYETAYYKMQDTVQKNNALKGELTMQIDLAMVQLEGLRAQEAAAGVSASGSGAMAEAKMLIDDATREMDIRSRTLEIGEDPYGNDSIQADLDMDNVLNDARSLVGKKSPSVAPVELQ
jgi:hypothetical protein